MIKVTLKKLVFGLMNLSLDLSTSKRQKYLMHQLEKIVPDISDARTQYKVSGKWLNKAFRTLDSH